MLVLALESSCDETAAALVEGPVVRGEVVRSQTDLHMAYGGVVPEIASRAHLEAADSLVVETLKRAGVGLGDVDALAVTQGPGLVGSLLVALNFAKGLSMSLGLPLTGVNHVQAHALAPFLRRAGDPERRVPEYPLVALVASGGHTSLFLVRSPLDFVVLGRTVDDAAGEAFDKSAKLMGLGYPGGAAVERLARDGDKKAFKFPRPLAREGFDFSFSGLKTSVQTAYQKGNMDDEPEGSRRLADLAASFQAAVVDVLVAKLARAAKVHGVRSAVLAGGVAANGELRRRLVEALAPADVFAGLSEPRWCQDNAAMIGYLGGFQLEARHNILDLSAEARHRWPVGE
ncbi:MAG: tRNA (adenosine(37)-N6)-threonylcarbamoyltransferase complex transferase subunit TsaD [Deltaproteobacteria bacterium]|jgi:N6-L-threonylcarbamoyladenine synthase|nr:tRNA (adenosine(37)-N6)-threonylcarbamoyltransferase complex transferase subunit TsaD [Deltaproteobacteria bacterium]